MSENMLHPSKITLSNAQMSDQIRSFLNRCNCSTTFPPITLQHLSLLECTTDIRYKASSFLSKCQSLKSLTITESTSSKTRASLAYTYSNMLRYSIFYDWKTLTELVFTTNSGIIFSKNMPLNSWLISLICSKCMGIGHFRRQCKQIQDTCKKCGRDVEDMINHSTTCTKLQCKHCVGDHMSNDMKCPVVKQFRADLTGFLLSPAIQSNPHLSNADLSNSTFPPLNPSQRPSIYNRHPKNNDIYKVNNINDHYRQDDVHSISPLMPYNQLFNTDTSNAIVSKIEDLINGLKQVNVTPEKIVNKNEQFE